MRTYYWLLLLLILTCKQESEVKVILEEEVTYQTPDQIFGELFTDVQLSTIFPDSKTFVDATAKYPYDSITSAFNRLKSQADFNLKGFVEDHFEVPSDRPSDFQTDTTKTPLEHIHHLWPVLTQRADTSKAYNSLIALPNPYVIPGGRFREVYYWDSYFTMLGLVEDSQFELIEDILDNFSYLIAEVGHIPNGNRTYYISRSQPPFFAQMIQLLADHQGKTVYARYREALKKEYLFWMAQDTIQNAYQHTVMTDVGLMNRYYDALNQPRQESFKEDYDLAQEHSMDTTLYRHLRAGAESGWDFSSRWFSNGTDLSTIETLHILPVDLNALMYGMETVLLNAYEGVDDAFVKQLQHSQKQRLQFLNVYSWNDNLGVFEDYNWVAQKQTGRMSLATVHPLYFKMATQAQADQVASYIEQHFLKPGGVVTSNYHTQQQWDAPNGWAPLQWLTVIGLEHYGHHQLARTIMTRWVKLNERVFEYSGKFVEKYNVEDLSLQAGGGEYPLQDGFGWSNGVYAAFKEKLQKEKALNPKN